MGLFSWLFGSSRKYKELPAKITKKRQRKIEVLVDDCKEWLMSAERVFVVCHFDETLELVQNAFVESGVKYNSANFEMNDSSLQRLLSEPAFDSVVLIPSRFLKFSPSSVAADLISTEKQAVILVAEKSPVQMQDQSVYDFAENLPFSCRIRVFASMDDYLMEFILGPWVRTMLEKMGFGEGEVMENNMINRRLSEAQKNFKLPPPRENPHSEQAWFATHPPKFN